MADKIIHQIPGFIIALSNVAVATAPYAEFSREDGSVSGAYVDLRDRDDLVETIAEARGSPGLRAVLSALNTKGSPFMTIGCEKGVFPCGDGGAGKPTCYVGAALDIVFRDDWRNRDPDQFVLLARAIVNNARSDPEQAFCFELIVEPLRQFFDRQDCFTLNLKLQGYGLSETAAGAAFERAAAEARRAIMDLTGASYFAYLKSSG
jgi:hypothetical protein